MGVDRTVAFFEGIEKLKEKYKEFIALVEIKEITKDLFYVMFHFEYVDVKLGGMYNRNHLHAIGYGILEGIEMALKQTQYKLRRKFALSKKKMKGMGLETVKMDESYLIQMPKTTRIQGKKFEIRIEDDQLVWETEQ